MTAEAPILEFDPDPTALIEPMPGGIELPEHCVVCFFDDVIGTLAEMQTLEPVGRTSFGARPIYRGTFVDRPVAVFQPGMSAARGACYLEQIIAMGCRKFIVCGAAGVLDPKIDPGAVIVTTSAVRDEGTSYHYLAPSREVEPTARARAALEEILVKEGMPFVHGKSWTTDGFFRETKGKLVRRRSEGCITVEMEASAFFAVARFRGVELASFFFAADSLSEDGWNFRDWNDLFLIRGRMFQLAVDAVLAI